MQGRYAQQAADQRVNRSRGNPEQCRMKRQEDERRRGDRRDERGPFDPGKISTLVTAPRKSNRPVRDQFRWNHDGIPEPADQGEQHRHLHP